MSTETTQQEAEVAAKVIGEVRSIAALGLGDAAPEIGVDTPLIELGIIDSLAVFQIAAFVEAEYGVEVPHTAMLPENFDSVRALSRMIVSLRQGA
ncbi:MAG TPA: acyl carrier protein [Thermoleophilaceae bacterium]